MQIQSFTQQEKKALIQKVPRWWHSIDLGDGITTPGKILQKGHRIKCSILPKNMQNKTVLDIGAWDGYYSFECERRGAKVTAIEKNYYEGFLTAKKILNSKVKFQKMDLFDLPKKQYDIVLFLGVLYHLKNPVKALEIMHTITKDLLLIDSYYIKKPSHPPLMTFFPERRKGNQQTFQGTKWGPNIKCIIEMLKYVGFRKVQIFRKYGHPLVTRRGRVMIKAYK